MERVDDEKWLDEALEGALHSDDTQPDFDRWKSHHPEAVATLTEQKPQPQQAPAAKPIRINAWFVKLAAAAVIAIAGIVAITQLPQATDPGATTTTAQAQDLTGPLTHTFGDGSIVTLAAGAQIRTYDEAGKRGFQHISGVIDVTVAKGLGEFIVTTPYGDVKALGTEFTLELVDGVTNDTKEPVNLLAVEVSEGKVEVSNARGKTLLEATQDAIVEKDGAPYDFNQDEALPEQLKERIEGMVAAFEAGDAAAWAANFNFDYLFQLIKGQVAYDPLRFGGSKEDAARLQEMLKDIQNPKELSQAFTDGVNISAPVTVYVRSVELSADGTHAKAECVQRKSERRMTITRPQWHHFDNDWWQIDD